MDIASVAVVVVVSVLLLLVAVGLIVSHVYSWRAFQQAGLEAEELDYRRRQFRRRMQTSATLGLLAIAVLVGYVLTIWLRSGWFMLVFWGAVMGLACWVTLLATVDIWATKHHFSRQRDHCLVEQAKLRAEIRRLQAFRGNGKGKHTVGETKGEGKEGPGR
jgi:hypothetical protein